MVVGVGARQKSERKMGGGGEEIDQGTHERKFGDQ